MDERATVRKVFDGDTVELTDGRHVRFVGINAPEVAHQDKLAEPLAEEARAALAAALKKDPTVLLRYDAERVDVHQRTLAHLYLSDRRSLAALLLEQGLAFWVAIPPDLHNAECYRAREQQARSAKRGIWSNAYYTPLDAQKVGRGADGFHVVKGRVERIGKSKGTIWLNLAPKMALRIAREDLRYFTSYKPESLRVDAGTAVTWEQQDPGFHTVTSGTVEQGTGGVTEKPDGRFDSGQLATGKTFSFTFEQPGTYSYFCAVHPATMRGSVQVG